MFLTAKFRTKYQFTAVHLQPLFTAVQPLFTAVQPLFTAVQPLFTA